MGAQDEATFGLLPLIARGWARKGSKPIVTINSKHECINVFGARTKRAFVYAFAKRKTQREFTRFLSKLQRQWNRVLLFVDNGPCHHGKIVDKFLAEHRKTFKLRYFLKYTPELNPTEQCWKPARKALANRVLRTLPAAQYHLRKTFNNAKGLPKYFQYL